MLLKNMKKVSGIKKISKIKHLQIRDEIKEKHINVNKTIAHESQSITEGVNNEIDPKDIRVLFMGTGVFAGNILLKIKEWVNLKKMYIITQPDKKIGRKKSSIHRTLAPNPVRDFAKDNNINLLQPTKLNDDIITKIEELQPDIIIVSAYGRILPKEILQIPSFGSINIHASLLPNLRGASPVQNALLIGLKETGVTIMKMDEGLDTGDIIVQEKTKIQEHEKADRLLERLSKIGGTLLNSNITDWINNNITTITQDDSKATICQLIDREDGHIQWTQTTNEIYNRYRALFPWPGIFSYWEETENQLIRIKLRAIYPFKNKLTDEQQQLLPGTVFIGHDQLCIKTFDTAVIVEAVQPECKTVMPVYDFLNGHNTFEGAVLK